MPISHSFDAVLTGKSFLLQCDMPNIRIDSILDSRLQDLAASNNWLQEYSGMLWKARNIFSWPQISTASPNSNKGNFLFLVEFRALTDRVVCTILDNVSKNEKIYI